MSSNDFNAGMRRRRADRVADPMQSEPSMSAPSPMPGKPAASYVKQQPAPQPRADWNPPQEQPAWSNGQYQPNPQYGNYPAQQYSQPSQGIPPQAAQQYEAWQQGYSPAPQQQGWSQPYQPPAGRGWTQSYPAQQQQNAWQGGYTVNQWNGNGYTPVYEEAPGQGSASGQGGNGSGGKFNAGRVKLVIAAVVVLLAIGLTAGLLIRQGQLRAVYNAVAAYDDLYCQGVYVDGIHLGGMTREEALDAVQKSAQLKCDEWHVRMETPQGEYVGEINSYHLGMSVHVEDALADAWQQGHTGDTNARKAAMDALLVENYHISTALPSSDTAAIDNILNEIAANVYIAATEAKAEYRPENTNPFEVFPHSNGRWLDVESIKAQVYDMVSRMETGIIYIEPQVLYPNVTTEQVLQSTSLIASAYTRISSTSEEGRNLNIERACDLINGVKIMPGETFSFNKIVGARTKNNGFYKAIEYAYKQQVEGYGGGVCQVSSTIYWAAVRANMEIVKREQHSLEVGYTEFGFDATVNYEGRKIDFVFRNNTDSPIYVITKVVRRPKVDKQHNLVLCEIYGKPLENGVTYDIVAVKTEVPIPEATIVPDKTAQYVIYTDDLPYTVAGKVGYEVDSFKVKYVDGKEVERTPLYHDTYDPVQPVTYMGVSERPIETAEPW